MNFRTTLILLVVLAAALSFVAVSRWMGGAEPPADGDGYKLIAFKSDQVTEVRIRQQGKAELVLQKDGENWKMATPVTAEAERFQVSDLVERVIGAEPRPGLVPLGGDMLKSTGLDAPRIVIDLKNKDGKTETLEVGNRSALGTDLYVRVKGQKDGRMVSAGVLGDRLDDVEKLAQSMRKKELLTIASGDVKRMEIVPTDGPKVVLQRSGLDWKIVEPQALDADMREVGDVVSAVTTLRAEEFLDASSPLMAGARFDRPMATVKLWKDVPATQPATMPVGADATILPATQPAPAATIVFGQFADISREKILVRVGDTVAKAAVTKENWEKIGEASILSLRDRKLLDIEEGKIKSIQIVTDTIATTRPTTKPAAKNVVKLVRTVTPATKPATTQTTQPATTQAAPPTPSVPPLPPIIKWVLEVEGKPAATVDQPKLSKLLGDLRPLRAQKFIAKSPVTQPADTITVTIVTDEKTHTIKYSDRGGTTNAIGRYNDLVFEADADILANLKADFGTPSSVEPPMPSGMPGMPRMPGMPPGHGEDDGHGH